MNQKRGFRNFVFQERKWWFWGAVAFLLYQFALIKIMFPHAILIGDTLNYVRAAENNLMLSAWPMGYSKLLEWMHAVIPGAGMIVILQYILLEGAVLYFYFTLLYFFQPGKWISFLILICLLANPFILFVSNYILPDALFAAFTILWFTGMVWFLYEPKVIYTYGLVTLIFLLFTLRYYAIFYPLIMIPILIWSKIPWKHKLLSIGMGVLLFFVYINYTERIYQKQIGRPVFSPISGWQLAGNALVMYYHIAAQDNDIVPARFKALHRLAVHDLTTRPSLNSMLDKNSSLFFMWGSRSPLEEYPNINFYFDTSLEKMKDWTSQADLYHDYGLFLIRHHPVAYLHYFVGDNTVRFFFPPVEYSNVFKYGGILISQKEQQWFQLPFPWLNCSRTALFSITYFPYIIFAFNVLFLLGMVCLIGIQPAWLRDPVARKILILYTLYWLLNFLFIVFTTPNVLRYALSVLILNIGFVPILWNGIAEKIKTKKIVNAHFPSI